MRLNSAKFYTVKQKAALNISAVISSKRNNVDVFRQQTRM
jgi:hypothetical protein